MYDGRMIRAGSGLTVLQNLIRYSAFDLEFSSGSACAPHQIGLKFSAGPLGVPPSQKFRPPLQLVLERRGESPPAPFIPGSFLPKGGSPLLTPSRQKLTWKNFCTVGQTRV